MQANAIENYKPEAGQRFWDNQNVAPSTMSAYACAVRRLNDAYCGKEYRCHHENDTQTICKHFSNLLEKYKEDCIQNGNKLGNLMDTTSEARNPVNSTSITMAVFVEILP